MKTTYGFIGCGNMGGALAAAVAKSVSGERLLLCDTNMERAKSCASAFGADVADTKTVAATCSFIFLGVKPQSFAALFEEIAPVLAKRRDEYVLVSMAAGLTIEKIEQLSEKNCPIIRIMPNTPVSVGEGMVLYCTNHAVTDGLREEFLHALANVGRLDSIEECKIDAASALSGCGPAYVYLFAEAMADGAVACDLPREKANLYAAQTLMGAAKLLLESGKHAGELKDAVCSPGGTTIAGVQALESHAFRSAAMTAVIAAYEKTLQLKSK